jgi:hypothetical protein
MPAMQNGERSMGIAVHMRAAMRIHQADADRTEADHDRLFVMRQGVGCARVGRDDSRTAVSTVKLLAIDPGNEESAYVVYDCETGRVQSFGRRDNERLRHGVRGTTSGVHCQHLAIEMIASYGMPVGREVFETCVWTGRFVEAWSAPYTFVYRKDVKLHLCGNVRAKDGNVRQALIDRYGGKQKAIGTKRAPGSLHGISADVWSALAVAVTWSDGQKTGFE